MVAKHDRTPVRTASHIEQKYDLGKETSALSVAADAQRTAERASNAVDALDKRVDKLEEGGTGGVDLSAVYPVGSIYLSVVETNPATLFGFGTWEQIKDKFLLSAGDTYAAGSEGGEAEHTLTEDELPNIQGTLPHIAYCESKVTGAFSFEQSGVTSYEGQYANVQNQYHYSMNFGNDQPHNNMPPYLAVYVWQRTA